MIVLDKSRALDLMISRAERVQVPAPFHAGLWPEPVPRVADDLAPGPQHRFTNLLARQRASDRTVHAA